MQLFRAVCGDTVRNNFVHVGFLEIVLCKSYVETIESCMNTKIVLVMADVTIYNTFAKLGYSISMRHEALLRCCPHDCKIKWRKFSVASRRQLAGMRFWDLFVSLSLLLLLFVRTNTWDIARFLQSMVCAIRRAASSRLEIGKLDSSLFLFAHV